MQIELKPSDFFKRGFNRISQGESFSFDIPNYLHLSEVANSNDYQILSEDNKFMLKMDAKTKL